ncbi:PaaI family thioesterase [Pseudovibrio sp. SPO723]|uniref:PaaI family thioesterase n=1 Tax=Nesiotobacter zosterae TaxID=392721 RepID=UPI0029C3F389|nr:PaaI family thioesterase [Pseudovibrio sp. SPO723]MDX5593478.1 PaaI family thioesterase [Pseudovibrio sp. SPO723]
MDNNDTLTTKSRSYEYAVAKFNIEAAMNMSGLEYMRALAAGEIGAPPPIAQTVNMSLPFALEEGSAIVEAYPADFLLNPMGFVHGGFAATILDTVVGIAVHTSLPKGIGYTTAQLNLNYTRAILPSTGKLRAQGKVIHSGRQMATAEGYLHGVEDGKLYAHATTTCFLFPLKLHKGQVAE